MDKDRQQKTKNGSQAPGHANDQLGENESHFSKNSGTCGCSKSEEKSKNTKK